MLQAMNTGHEGSMTTIHANSPRDALGFVENRDSHYGFGVIQAWDGTIRHHRGPVGQNGAALFGKAE
jgi:type IV secretory pathway ATPase VirB11/archaellum biosynthesis ATPase